MAKMTKTACAAAVVALAAGAAQAGPLDDLAAAAKKEGQLTVIALTRTWCNYGGVIDSFKAKYPEIKVNELNPDGSSADELEAIRANKTNKGPQAPDAIDVGLAFGPQAKAEGLIAPYKVSTWDDIPADIKDPEGHWYADYYGVMGIGVNTDLVKTLPTDWADLLKPDYAQSVALAGDPRASNQAILAVMAVGVGAGGAPGAESGKKGLDFFAALNKAGNFVPVTGKAGTIAQGQTPIVAAWDYNLLSWRDSLKGNPPVKVIIPSSASLAGVYVQAISAYAPHPNAAKLWMEHIYSDQGQVTLLKGYCHPARFAALDKAGAFSMNMIESLPPAEAYKKAIYATVEQQEANKAVVTSEWDKTVGANVK